jgi:hypothetical protein
VSLLRDIQNSAVGKDASVEVLLRQCVVLAARLQHNPLREWANRELTGYPGDQPLPPYRPIINTTVLGNLAGPFQSGLRNAGLASSCVPDEWGLREALFTFEVRMGVPEMESLLSSGEQTFTFPWPTDVVALVQTRFYTNMNLMQAWKVIPATVFHGTLSGIRDRVLQFALEIESENPAAGEAEPGETPIPDQRVTQIFTQNIYGDNAAVATAAGDAVAAAGTSVNLEALRVALRGLGIHETEQEELVTAVREEGGRGPRANAWLGRLQSGAIQLGSGVTVATAADLLSKLLGG